MDRSLKARLIGAAVLVVLVVALVPELLTGPKPSQPQSTGMQGARSTRSVTIELGGEAGGVAEPAAERAPVSQPVARTETPEPLPPPVAAPPEAPRVAPPAGRAIEAQAGAAPPPAPEPRRSPPEAPAEPPVDRTAAAAGGGWSVQVGAFSAPASARKLVQELESAGFRAYVSPFRRSGKELHRVRVGPEPDRHDAERLAASLKQRGLPATVVAND